MSNVLQTGKEGTPSERRVYARQSLGALAYLDIGPDNGGIAVNISEGGMKVQAVSPLEDHSDLKLRVQLPGRSVRIDADARVVWLGKGGKQAGLRFSGLSEDFRGAIVEWIRSEGWPTPKTREEVTEENKPMEFATPPAATSASASPEPEQLSSSSVDAGKWRRLVSELQSVRSPQEPMAKVRLGVSASPLNELRSVSEARKPQIVSRFSERVNQSAAVPPRIVPTDPSAPAQTPSSLKLQHEAIGRQDEASRNLTSHLTIRGKRPPEPLPPDVPSLASALTEASAGDGLVPAPPVAESKTDVAAKPWPPLSASRVAAAKRVTNYSAVAALVIALAVASFAVGRWIGLADRPSRIEKAPSAPNESSSTPNATSATSIRPGSAHKTIRRFEPQQQASRLAPQFAKSIPRRENLDAPANPPRTVSVDAPALPQQSLPTPLVPKPLDNSPTPNLSTEKHPAMDSPAPVMIDGHILRPTDRFNPSHLVYRVEPVYPPEAKREQIQGAVKIHQVIGPDGNVESVRLLSGPSLLAPAAMDAARYWRYFPALLNGQPVATEQDVEIDFRLPQ